MSSHSRFSTWWKAIFHPDTLDQQVSEELRFHIESRTDDLMHTGLPREEASRRARAELGSLVAVRENSRHAWALASSTTSVAISAMRCAPWPEPRLRRHRYRFPRPRHRCQHRDLHDRATRPVRPAARAAS